MNQQKAFQLSRNPCALLHKLNRYSNGMAPLHPMANRFTIFQITAFNQTFSLFFAAASAVGVSVSGRMMGRLRDTLWWLPLWMAVSMGLYLGAVKAVGG